MWLWTWNGFLFVCHNCFDAEISICNSIPKLGLKVSLQVLSMLFKFWLKICSWTLNSFISYSPLPYMSSNPIYFIFNLFRNMRELFDEYTDYWH